MASEHNIVIKFASSFIGKGIAAAKSAFSSLAGHVKSFTAKVGGNLANVKAGLDMLVGAFGKLRGLFGEFFKFETQTRQFKTLIGDMDDARKHMEMLREMGNTPPFSLDAFAEASRSLIVLSDGALGFRHSLKLVGDAAAATGQPLEAVSQAVGQMYAMIRDGEPIGRAATQLRRMGVLTPAVVAELDAMQKANATSIEIWDKVEEALGRFSGAMAESEQTGKGLADAISSRWTNLVRQFGDAFMDAAKGGMKWVLDKMIELEKNGAIQRWAEKTVAAIRSVVEMARKAASALRAIPEFGERVGDAVGGFIGGLRGGGSIREAAQQSRQMYRDTKRNQEAVREAAKAVAKEVAKETVKSQKPSAGAATAKARDSAERARLVEALAGGKAAQKAELRRDQISREMTEYVDKAAKDERKREAEKTMEAQRDADKELQRGFDRSIEKLVGEIKLIEKAAERTNRGVAKDNSGYQYHFGDNGRINDFEDWQRAQRFAKRDDRDRRNAERHNEWLKNDLEEKERRGRLSESDARRLKQLRQFNEERKGEEKRQQQIEDLRKKQQQAIIDSEKHLKALKEKVDKFVESGVLQ